MKFDIQQPANIRFTEMKNSYIMGLRPLTFARNGIRILPSCIRNQMFNFSTAGIRNREAKEEPCKAEEDDVIIKCLDGGKGLITLNRPKQLNTLNASMVCKIRKTLLDWKDNKYLIAIKGSGDKAFCAGGDVVAVVKDKTCKVGKTFFREEYKMDALISTLRIPFVAFLNGIVMGGGVGISIFGSYRIATETSMFAMPETQIGLFPDVGVSYKLARMPNQLGNFLALTGYRLKGYDLVHAGIATHFCKQDKLKDLENALLCDFAKSCCSCPEETLREYHEASVKDAQPPEFSLKKELENIQCWFSGCNIEEVMKKIGEDKSPFAAETLDCLKKMSPLSLKVTFKQIKDAANLEIFDCFNVDYRLAVRSLSDGDFPEGVRALLIDKDKKPKWKHAEVCQVKDEEVDAFFCPLPEEEELKLPDSLCYPCEE